MIGSWQGTLAEYEGNNQYRIYDLLNRKGPCKKGPGDFDDIAWEESDDALFSVNFQILGGMRVIRSKMIQTMTLLMKAEVTSHLQVL